jgi:hypothetical protein
MYQNLLNKLAELKERNFTVGTSKGSLAVQQTERNILKAELIQCLFKDLEEIGEAAECEVYITKDGPIIEVQNESIENQIDRLDQDGLCSGMLSLEFDIIIKNLDYDASIMQEEYFEDLKISAEKAAKVAEETERKKMRDAEARAEKARQRQVKLNSYMNKDEK